MFDLKNKTVTIIGGKRSGIALARLINRLGGKPKISDHGHPEHINPKIREWLDTYEIPSEFNGHTQKFIENSDLVILSPGVRLDAPPVKWAERRGLPVLGEIEFAYQFCPVPIVAVTGSNGKTTTATLIRDVIEASGKKA